MTECRKFPSPGSSYFYGKRCTEKVFYFQISAVYGPMGLFETTNTHLIPMPKKIEGLLMSLKSVLTFISCPDILDFTRWIRMQVNGYKTAM